MGTMKHGWPSDYRRREVTMMTIMEDRVEELHQV